MKIAPSQIAVFQRLHDIALQQEKRLYVVGGYVRDLLLGKEISDKDVDVMVEGDGVCFAEICHAEIGGALKIFPAFGTAKIIKPSTLPGVDEVDIASARKEIYAAPGALPTVTLATLDEDLHRRDFTMNAMALPVDAILACVEHASEEWRNAVVDKYGGSADLQSKIIRVLHDRSFHDDPTRLYRAIRYRNRVDGAFDLHTRELFSLAVTSGALETVSAFRKVTEVKKLLDEKPSRQGLYDCLQEGLLAFALPDPLMEKVLDELYGAWQTPTPDQFLAAVLASKNETQKQQFAREIQLGSRKLKELLCR